MDYRKNSIRYVAAVAFFCLSGIAHAQTQDVPTTPTPVSAPATAPPAQTAAPSTSVVQPIPPPGYMLVPVGSTNSSFVEQKTDAEKPKDELPYSEGHPIPNGYHVEERLRRGLVIGGSLTLGIPWVFSSTAAVGNDFKDKTGFLMVPAIGPWLMLAAGGASDDDCTSDDFSGDLCKSEHATQRGLLFLDGIAQTTGAILLAVGIGYPAKRLIRDTVSLSMAPTSLGRDGYGLSATGTF
jgi:hypothetical protein